MRTAIATRPIVRLEIALGGRKGYIGFYSGDNGRSWNEMTFTGAQSRAWWRRHASTNNRILREIRYGTRA